MENSLICHDYHDSCLILAAFKAFQLIKYSIKITPIVHILPTLIFKPTALAKFHFKQTSRISQEDTREIYQDHLLSRRFRSRNASFLLLNVELDWQIQQFTFNQCPLF